MTDATRERLTAGAAALFAARGFAATAVGDIEERAGFTRRGGTFYRHFASKDEVLLAVVDRHSSSVRQLEQIRTLLPLGDRRAELTLLGRQLLAELDREEEIHLILEKDGDRLAGIRDMMAGDVLGRGYRELVSLFAMWLGDDRDDLEALVIVLVGGLVNLRRNLWTFGGVPLGVSDERALAAWVDLVECLATVDPAKN